MAERSSNAKVHCGHCQSTQALGFPLGRQILVHKDKERFNSFMLKREISRKNPQNPLLQFPANTSNDIPVIF